MKNIRLLGLSRSLSLLAVGCALALTTAACSGAVADQKPQTGASALAKAPVAATAHGPVKLVGEALGEVSLRADQRAEIEKLAASAETRHSAIAGARQDLLAAVADQVEKGAIDKSALQPKIDKVTQDAEKARVEDRAALVKMHGLLDAEQRNAFVDALHDKMHDKMKGHAGAGFGRLKELATDLKLTDDQVTQIKAVMKAEHGEHARGEHGEHARGEHGKGGHHDRGGKKALESFRGETFDATALGDGKMTEGATKMIGAIEKVVPILTPEQRKIAADKIRALKDQPF